MNDVGATSLRSLLKLFIMVLAAVTTVNAETPNDPPDKRDIIFVTAPVRKATVGVEYTYDADAVVAADSLAVVEYSLVTAPNGMVVDSATGNVTWTPTASGQYKVELRASVLGNALLSVKQQWTLQVSVKKDTAGGDTTDVDTSGNRKWCAYITGMVVADSTGDTMQTGIVIASKVDADSGARVPPGHMNRTAPIVNGRYEIAVLPGTYVLYVQGSAFLDEFHQDAASLDSAMRIQVDCDDTATADFSVALQSPEQRFTVTGRVTVGDSTGADAKVEFIAVDKEGFVFAGRHEWNGKARFSTHTDSAGYYSITLSNKFRYIARAVPEGDSLATQYYNGVANIADAVQILLTGDRDSINFKLDTIPAANGGFTGVVQAQDSAQTGIVANVVVFQLVAKNGTKVHQKRVMTVETDSVGAFSVTGLEAGEYVLLVIPSSHNYVAGYYKDSAAAVRSWRDATRITVTDSAAASAYTVLLAERAKGRGMVKVKGGVAGRGPTIKGTSHGPLGEEGLSGALVMAIDANDQVVDYSFSDASGGYEMNELGAGEYTLFADKFEFEPYRGTVTVDYEERSEVSIGITLFQAAVSSAPAVVENVLQSAIYPNPVSASSQVRFVAERGWADITVIDPSGAEVRTTRIETTEGENSYRFDAAGLPNGVYFVRIKSGAQSSTIPAVVLR